MGKRKNKKVVVPMDMDQFIPSRPDGLKGLPPNCLKRLRKKGLSIIQPGNLCLILTDWYVQQARRTARRGPFHLSDDGRVAFLCWRVARPAYASSDLTSAIRIIRHWEDTYIPLCAWYLSNHVEPEMLGKDKHAEKGHVCYGNSIAEALEHIEREGIPKEIPQFRQYKCRRYPPSAHKRKHKIKSVLSFDTLDKALAHLHIQPVGAALITFPELWRIGEHIYRGPLEENTQFTGFHDVVIVKVDVINREQVALCKLSNGPKIGVGGYVWVSLEVMYMVVGAQDNDKDMLRPSSTPRHLLSDFNCPLMDEAPRANLKRKQEQQDEPKRSKKRRRQRVARSSSKLHSNLDDDDVASLHGQVRQLINTRDTNSHDQEASHEDDKPAVVTSDNLPISTEECSQLSFGSSPLSNNAGETSDVASKMEHSDARSTDFYGHSMGSSNSHNALSLGGPSSSMPEDG
ncbi:unnamed protein product [Arabidopsis thaliana]|uniref:Uncharacterized protein n=2 Tax=Arabidopsis thaliana TaxID=3702 RepID=A0A5S9VJA1_ARATH|nr:unnamed protein product [Arabidopsis thaliana]VYS46858.1 unnamed protein product [Arabidopsis thaliana]